MNIHQPYHLAAFLSPIVLCAPAIASQATMPSEMLTQYIADLKITPHGFYEGSLRQLNFFGHYLQENPNLCDDANGYDYRAFLTFREEMFIKNEQIMLHSDLPQVHQDYIRERITIREASHHACTSNASLKELECTLSQNNKRLESLHLKNRYKSIRKEVEAVYALGYISQILTAINDIRHSSDSSDTKNLMEYHLAKYSNYISIFRMILMEQLDISKINPKLLPSSLSQLEQGCETIQNIAASEDYLRRQLSKLPSDSLESRFLQLDSIGKAIFFAEQAQEYRFVAGVMEATDWPNPDDQPTTTNADSLLLQVFLPEPEKIIKDGSEADYLRTQADIYDEYAQIYLLIDASIDAIILP